MGCVQSPLSRISNMGFGSVLDAPTDREATEVLNNLQLKLRDDQPNK